MHLPGSGATVRFRDLPNIFLVTFFPACRLSRVLTGRESALPVASDTASVRLWQHEKPVSDMEQPALADTALDEAALIRAAQRGNQDAFERLVRRYDQSVLKLAHNLLRSPEDAQDIYQEAFLRVHRNLHQFRFDCSFHTWLYRIVTNLCLDQMRKKRVRKEESSVVDTSDGTRDRAEMASDARGSTDPQRAVMSGQLKSRIDAVLASLSPRERMVFELRHYEGMRLRAIGEVLGTSEEAAKNCLFRVTQKMRVALGDFV